MILIYDIDFEFVVTVHLGKAKVVHLQYLCRFENRRISRSNHAHDCNSHTLRLLHWQIRFFVATNHQENEVPNLY